MTTPLKIAARQIPAADLARILPRDGLIYAIWGMRERWPPDLFDLIRSGAFRAGYVSPPPADAGRPHTPGYSTVHPGSHS